MQEDARSIDEAGRIAMGGYMDTYAQLTVSRERVERLEGALTVASDSFRSHGFAVDADECDEALAPASEGKV